MINQSSQPESHYEIFYEGENTSAVNFLKNSAFNAMDQLEGWCSKEKASVLIDLILTMKPRTIVEIGVFGGKSLVPMAFALKKNGSGRVFGIDPWSNVESVVGMDEVNSNWWINLDHEAIYQGLMHKVKQFNLQNYISLVRSTSKEADLIPDIDILHIDGNHSEENSYLDVTKWVSLVRKGGIILIQDLNWMVNGVNTMNSAVTWLNQNCVKSIEFSGENAWGIWIKP